MNLPRFLARAFVARRRDERGAVLVMATFGIVVAVIAASLAVDLGQIAQERRRNQKVADLAALDAARNLSDVQNLAEESALRNEFPLGGSNTVVAIIGNKVNGSCVADAGAGTVCVTVTSNVDYAFRAGDPPVTAVAVAGSQSSAAFTIGSKLASASLSPELPLLNAVMSRWLGASGTVNVLSYNGLVDSTINLRQLSAQFGFGTMNELLTTGITLGQLLSAASTVMAANGASNASVLTPLATLQAAVTNTTMFKLGDYIEVASGYDDKALDGAVNLFQIITAGAQLINKNNFLDAGTVLSVPNPLSSTGGVLTTKLGVKVIEGPKLYIGGTAGPYPHAKTSQVEVTITPHIDVNFDTPLLNILNLLQIGTSPVRIVGDMPVVFTAAGAEGNLTDIRCTGSQGITVQVQRKAVNTSTSASLQLYTQGAILQAANVRANIAVGPTSASVAAPGSPDTLTFAYPGEFWPSTVKDTPGSPANIVLSGGGAGANVSASVGALGIQINLLSTLGLSNILTSVVSPILNPIMNDVVNKLTTPAMKALGLSIGPVDVTAPSAYFNTTTCGQPGLV
ncbi:MAG: pilus assembly protein TadG-related protein, partial [Acidimicrobiales bacterium]